MGLFGDNFNLLDILDSPTQVLGSLTGHEDVANQLGDPLDILGIQGGAAADEAAQIQSANYLKALDELKRQFSISQDNIRPFMQAGENTLPFLTQASNPQGMDAILRNIIGTDAFGSLVDERRLGVEGMLGAGGLTRSGVAIEEGARIPTDLAFEISQILTGNARHLSTGGQNAAVGAGTLGGQFGGQQAQLQGQSGNALASGILGAQQAQAQGAQNGASLLASIFSDPRLKNDITKIGDIGPLGLYQWSWKPEFSDTVVMDCPTVGFLSPEVKEHYPEFVGEFGGYDTINYKRLIEVLECH